MDSAVGWGGVLEGQTAIVSDPESRIILEGEVAEIGQVARQEARVVAAGKGRVVCQKLGTGLHHLELLKVKKRVSSAVEVRLGLGEAKAATGRGGTEARCGLPVIKSRQEVLNFRDIARGRCVGSHGGKRLGSVIFE